MKSGEREYPFFEGVDVQRSQLAKERSHNMIPDRYTIEKMVGEHRQTLLREVEHQRMLAIVDPPKHVLQGFAGKLGGTCLC